MKNKLLFLFALAGFYNPVIHAQPSIALQSVGSGFTKPVDIANAGDSRLFIVEQDGIIRILNTDGTTSVFLNINSRVYSIGGEQGLLGLAFHPNYVVNGSVAILIPKGNFQLSEKQMKYIASDEFRKFYKIARNFV